MEELLKYDPKKDPYLKGTNWDTINEMDDFVIRDTDLVILTGVSEDEEVSHLDVYIFETKEVKRRFLKISPNRQQNAYIHHDYLLPSFPLCLAWLNFPVGADSSEGSANMVAIGTFEPYIEIWDLDIVDCPSPAAILGGPEDLEKIGTHSNLTLVKGINSGKNTSGSLKSVLCPILFSNALN
jgi:periodic tryptophan protein 1